MGEGAEGLGREVITGKPCDLKLLVLFSLMNGT